MMLKRVGARTHPCLTPFVMEKATELSPLSCLHAIIKLSNNGDEFFGAAIFCRDSPKAVSADHVKCLGQINISQVEVNVLFLTLVRQQTPCQQSQVPYKSRIDSPVRVHVQDG